VLFKSSSPCRQQRSPRNAGWRGWVATLVFMLCLAGPASACTELTVGTRFWVRLTAPVSSYSAKRGLSVQGMLLQSPECENSAVLPIRIPVEGRVISAHRVGLGLWHETATLELEFTRLLLPDALPIGIQARVLQVENAREEVKKGVIHGIRPTDTPQGTISSRLRYMPSLRLYPDPFLLGYKLLFPIFPEPEICLKAGTDLQVELSRTALLPANLPLPTPPPALENRQDLAEDLAGLPERTLTRKGKQADVVNLALVGSRAQVEQAFAAAGWRQSEAVSRRSVGRELYAFLAKTSDPTAPMSPQLLRDRAPDLTLERTFDSYEKRDHLRLWSLPPSRDGEELWAGAAVRETGATLSVRHKGFMHHVSPSLEEEQQIVVRDLLAAKCVDAVGAIERPGMDRVLLNATGEIFRTDGSLTVLELKSCASGTHAGAFQDSSGSRPRSKVFRYIRKEVLIVRSDLWRANVLYGAFDLACITAQALHRNSQHRADLEFFHQNNQSPLLAATPSPPQPSE
jgi:hypothetical protein